MSVYNFGKTITRKFYPKENDLPLSIHSQAAEIYLFEDKPTLSNARDGTGATQTITYWTQSGVTPYPQTYQFTPVDDPDPTGGNLWRSYWEAINFVLEVTEQKQTVVREFKIERPKANEDIPGTTVADVEQVFPDIESYFDDSEIEGFLSVAETELKNELLALNVRWSQVSSLTNTKLAIAYKAISNASLVQIKEPGDRHNLRYNEFKAKYLITIKAIPLEIDLDGDGKADTKGPLISNTLIAYN